MITATCGLDGKPTFAATVRGVAIYLDNFAIKSLAKGEVSIRQRFIAALNNGADLLFSMANAVELSGYQGSSSITVKKFLNELGAHWYPVEMQPDLVMKRENTGEPPSACCFSGELLRAYFQNNTSEHSAGSGKIINLSEEFFRLGSFIDWLLPHRDWFLEKSKEFDEMLKTKIPLLRAKHKCDTKWLNNVIPQPQFVPSRATNFAYFGLMRDLISDSGYQLRKGDGMDFCHAVISSAFATFATLDKQWKRRVENLPKPNGLARIYYEKEISSMIDDIELSLAELKNKI